MSMDDDGGSPATTEIFPATTGDVRMGDAIASYANVDIEKELVAAQERQTSNRLVGRSRASLKIFQIW